MIVTTMAGIQIPDSALARDIAQFVQDVESPLLFGHSRRVFLWVALRLTSTPCGSTRSCSTSARCFTTSAWWTATALQTSASRSTAPMPHRPAERSSSVTAAAGRERTTSSMRRADRTIVPWIALRPFSKSEVCPSKDRDGVGRGGATHDARDPEIQGRRGLAPGVGPSVRRGGTASRATFPASTGPRSPQSIRERTSRQALGRSSSRGCVPSRRPPLTR